MNPFFKDRFEQDEAGQPIRVARTWASPIRGATQKLANVEHWAVKALFTTLLSIAAAFVTARLTAKHEDSAKVRDIQELHARIAQLEIRLKDLEGKNRRLILLRDADHDGVAGPQDKAALNLNANKQTTAKP